MGWPEVEMVDISPNCRIGEDGLNCEPCEQGASTATVDLSNDIAADEDEDVKKKKKKQEKRNEKREKRKKKNNPGAHQDHLQATAEYHTAATVERAEKTKERKRDSQEKKDRQL